MPGPTETVTAFLAEWPKPGGVEKSMRAYLTDDTVWENHGLVTTRGIEQACTFVTAIANQFGTKTQVMEVLAMAEAGNTLLMERIARLLDASGREVAAVRGMSVFEVRGGKITAWRDYYNTLPYG